MNPARCLPVAAVLALAALAGCSTCPPFRAAWYLHDPVAATAAAASAPSAPPAGLYLALLHEGSETSALTRVVVNPVGLAGGVALPPGSLGGPWQPGELRVFYVGTQLGRCSIPVAVKVECGGSCRPVARAVSGALPNALSDTWLSVCPAEAGR